MSAPLLTPHYEDAGLRLWHGRNLDILRADALGYPHDLGYHPDRLIPDGFYDSIVTDPPYELGFMGKGWDSSGIAYSVDVWAECLRVLKPGGHLLAFGGTRTYHRVACAIEDAGFEIRDSIAWLYGSGFPKSMNVAKAITGHESGHGSNSGAIRRATMGDAYVPSGRLGNRDGAGRRDTGLNEHDLTLSENAKAWDGWGTALKPALEPIVVARKPLAGTVAANVLAYGTGALNIDATRVGDGSGSQGERAPHERSSDRRYAEKGGTNFAATPGPRGGSPDGRWPANVVLSHAPLVDEHGVPVGDACADRCVEGCAVAALDAQSGVLSSGILAAHHARAPKEAGILGAMGAAEGARGYGDSGGASRFFPVFRYEAKAPTSERPNVDGTVHATVKPLALMRWLIRLVTRPGGRVADIYAGSGTTGEAALLEGDEADLIEMESVHLPLILARVRKPLHPAMFGDWNEVAS